MRGKKRRAVPAGPNRKQIPVPLGFLAFCALAFARDLPAAKPESVGLSSDRLERIATVQRNLDDRRIAGAVSLVVRHGKGAGFKAQGMSDRESGKPMTSDAMFRIGSRSWRIRRSNTEARVSMGALHLDGRRVYDFWQASLNLSTASVPRSGVSQWLRLG